MGSPPSPQQPRTQYPFAEYFNLAPGANIALEQRLSAFAPSTVVAVGAAGQGQAQQSFVIDPNWGFSHAFYLVRAYALYVPIDATGELQITQARMGVGIAPNNIFMDLGIPTSTTTQPTAAQVAIFSRDDLVHIVDTANWAQNTPLSMIMQVAVKNLDATNPHSFQLSAVAIWHRLTGFVQ